MVRNFFSFFLIILLVPFVLAAGGGGGSSSGSSSGGGSSSSTSGGDGPHFLGLKCLDTGQITFDQTPLVKPVIVGFENKTNITLIGTWDGTVFTSEEAQLNEQGEYTVYDPKNGNQVVECPGLKFSCAVVQMSMQSCTQKNGNFQGDFSLNNVNANELEITLSTPGEFENQVKTLKYGPKQKSTILKGAKIKSTDNLFEFTAQNLPVITNMQISHPQCIGKYYVYSKMECGETFDEILEQPGERLKCGGYLDIADRVRCRLNIEGTERDEHENFYPEECRTHQDPKACLKIYRDVSDCWDIKRCHMRTNCLKEKIGYNSELVCDDNTCNKQQNQKILTMIKLRFYNLEEQAEMLEEFGRLNKENLIDFVVKTENNKKAFNNAKSKDEMQQIIGQVKDDWNLLMQEVIK